VYYINNRVEIHASARRHGVDDDDIQHVAKHALVVADVDADLDPPKLLVIGPDRAGNLLEVIVLSLAADQILAIHAMPLRRRYYELLPDGGHNDG
jgi:hypothetical protein